MFVREVCAPTDHGKCCAGRASCHSFGNCQDGYALVAHPHATLCQGSGCTTGDHSTCCTPKGTCSSYECPPDYRLKPTASSILCDDVLCVDTHYSKCCGLEGMCSSYGCPPTYVHKPDAGSLRIHAPPTWLVPRRVPVPARRTDVPMAARPCASHGGSVAYRSYYL